MGETHRCQLINLATELSQGARDSLRACDSKSAYVSQNLRKSKLTVNAVNGIIAQFITSQFRQLSHQRKTAIERRFAAKQSSLIGFGAFRRRVFGHELRRRIFEDGEPVKGIDDGSEEVLEELRGCERACDGGDEGEKDDESGGDWRHDCLC
jgi:hypothetical protein